MRVKKIIVEHSKGISHIHKEDLQELEEYINDGLKDYSDIFENRFEKGFDRDDQGNKLITCVYCGHEYPNQTPTSGAQVLKDHIKVCERHPMREAEEKVKLLSSALLGLIGSDDKEELEQMEFVIRQTPAPEQDKEEIINAIHALLKTGNE